MPHILMRVTDQNQLRHIEENLGNKIRINLDEIGMQSEWSYVAAEKPIYVLFENTTSSEFAEALTKDEKLEVYTLPDSIDITTHDEHRHHKTVFDMRELDRSYKSITIEGAREPIPSFRR